MEKIIVKIKNGKVFIETEGFKGESCLEATKDILEKLGISETQVEKKLEYFEEAENENISNQI